LRLVCDSLPFSRATVPFAFGKLEMMSHFVDEHRDILDGLCGLTLQQIDGLRIFIVDGFNFFVSI
jgi:hypothetical protein